MRILNLKRKTIPKVAVLVTGLAAAVMVGVNTSQPAQASPSYASACSACHATLGGSVTATAPATVAPGASYDVTLAYTQGTGTAGATGYWIDNGGVPVTGSGAGPVTMTAPAVAGPHTYTVWMRDGSSASTTYTITVGDTTPTATATDSATSTATATATDSATSTATATATDSATSTATATDSATSTATATSTSTATDGDHKNKGHHYGHDKGHHYGHHKGHHGDHGDDNNGSGDGVSHC